MENGYLMNSLVSVVITCYNHELYIEECIRSIYNQTYRNIELIILNDGSKDASEKIIKQTLIDSPFEQTYYDSHTNMGLVKTRNKAIAKVNGNYILFVDSDNFLENNYIEELLKTAETNNFDITYTQIRDAETNAIILDALPFDLQHLYIENYIDSCSLIKLDILNGEVYDERLNYKKLEDYEFFLRLIIKNGAVAGPCQSTYLNYRVLNDSMSERTDLKYYFQVYSYILSKYTKYNPVFAEYAQLENFNRIFELSAPSGKFEKELISIYFGNKNDHINENSKLTFKFKKSNTINFLIPEDITFLRIDLSELPSFFKEVKLIDNEYNTEIAPSYTNGINFQDSFYFSKNDPQIYFDIKFSKSKSFTLIYDMVQIDNIVEDEFIQNDIIKKLSKQNENIKHLEYIKEQYKEVKSERDEYRRQIEDLLYRYNSLITSRRWSIPTKIINFLRRKK